MRRSAQCLLAIRQSIWKLYLPLRPSQHDVHVLFKIFVNAAADGQISFAFDSQNTVFRAVSESVEKIGVVAWRVFEFEALSLAANSFHHSVGGLRAFLGGRFFGNGPAFRETDAENKQRQSEE